MTRNCTTCGTAIVDGSRFCGRCGAPAPVEDPIETGIEEPAAYDPAPPIPQAPVPPGPDPTLITAAPYGSAGYATGTIEPQRPRAGRRVAVIAAIVAGVAALGVAGGILLRSGSSSGGGADTPDAAVRRMVAAVTDRDVIGAFQATAPDELRGAGDIYKASVDKARSLGMLKDGDPLGGLTLSMAGLKLETTSLGDDLARVTVGAGTLSYKVDPKGFPVGDKYKDDFNASFESVDPAELEGSVDIVEEAGEAPVLYTVRRGGRWYVSLYSTITHYMGFDPAATTGADPNRTAAGSPEAALTNLMQGAARLDPDAVLNAIAPAEARIARIYETYIREAFEGARSSGAKITVGSPQLETDPIDGNRAKVWINKMSVAVEMQEEGSFRVEVDGSCATMTSGVESERFCLSDAGIDEYLHLIPSRGFVVAVKDDKGWYVSTVETMFEFIRHTISAVKQSDIDALINAISSGGFE